MRVRRERWMWVVLGLSVGLAGCGGQYVVSAPDQVGAAGSEAPVVIRLQRNDFFVLDMAWKEAPIRFHISRGGQRVAYTDDDGYAGTLVPTPVKPGHYAVTIEYQDLDGEEIFAQAPVYVWDPAETVVVVEYEALPMDVLDLEAAEAAEALQAVAKGARIVYLTRYDVDEHQYAHQQLAAGGYPAGPVLRWTRERYPVKKRKYGITHWRMAPMLVSQLDALKQTFPKLSIGIASTGLAAETFAGIGLKTYMVGWEDAPTSEDIVVTSWLEMSIRPPVNPSPRLRARRPERPTAPVIQPPTDTHLLPPSTQPKIPLQPPRSPQPPKVEPSAPGPTDLRDIN